MQRCTLDIVDSTNLEAKRRFASGQVTAPTLIVARAQSAGRGSRGRSWVSPRDAGIYMSVVDIPPDPPPVSELDLAQFTRAAGIACVDVLRERTGVSVRIKPINDLHVDSRKLGGILTEAIVERDRVRALITGVGINVRTANRPVDAGAPEPVALQALMAAHAFAHLNVTDLEDSLAESVLLWNRYVWANEIERVKSAWAHRCAL